MPTNNSLFQPIPEEFPSIEAARKFWDAHSTAEHWNDMVDVDMRLSPAFRASLETKKLYRLLGLSAQQVSVIEQEANRGHTGTRQLITHCVREYIQNLERVFV